MAVPPGGAAQEAHEAPRLHGGRQEEEGPEARGLPPLCAREMCLQIEHKMSYKMIQYSTMK